MDDNDFFDSTGVAVGIDLGTSNSVVAKFNQRGDYLFLHENGKNYIKSALFYKNEDEVLFGNTAFARGIIHPKSLLRCFKRGLTSNEAHMENGKYKVICSENQNELLLPPRDAIQEFLRCLIERFSGVNDLQVDQLVITVPAKFGAGLCKAIQQAGNQIGMSDVLIVQEPVAAAICYDYEVSHIEDDSSLLVYDLGAGTFDISLLKRKNGVLEFTDSNGDVHLGGEDFTNKVFVDLKDYISYELDIDDPSEFLDENEYLHNLEVLRKAAESAKEYVSFANTYNDPIILKSNKQNIEFSDWAITRYNLESKISKDIQRSIDKIDILLKRNQLTIQDIDKVLVVGGSSLIPLVKEKLVEYFEDENKIINNEDKELMIGKGAAIIAHEIFENGTKDLEGAINFSGTIQKTSETIGLAIANRFNIKTIFNRGCKVPCEVSLTYPLVDLLNKDGCISLSFYNYDEMEVTDLPQIMTYHSEVEFIGKCMSETVNRNVGNESAQIKIKLTNEFIINVDVFVNEEKIFSGSARREDV